MNILLTNDDGYQAPGINFLFKELEKDNNIIMVAPSKEQSGTGMAFTLNESLTLKEISDKIYSLDGTPVDCVKTGTMNNIGFKIDLVISGINNGPNVGTDINYSGTVSAARHAFYLGYSAISISRQFGNQEDGFFKEAALIAEMIKKIDLSGPKFFYNINFPADFDDINGMECTYCGKRHYQDYLREEIISEKTRIIYFHSDPPVDTGEQGTDVFSIKNHKISITPISAFYNTYPIWLDAIATDNNKQIVKLLDKILNKDKNLKHLINYINSGFKKK